MKTNYDVNDVVLIKAKVDSIKIDHKGNIIYRLCISHGAGYIDYYQDEIAGKLAEFEEESDVQQ